MNQGMNQYTHKGDAQLRLALRALQREVAPARDLWPGIASRLAAQPARPVSGWRTWPWALAASLLLMLGLAGQPGPHHARPVAVPSPPDAAVAALPPQAQLLTRHYQAALRELEPHAAPANWQPGLQALDQGAQQVREALRKNPDSPLLLGQLRQIYARKLALSRRALFA